MPISSALRDSIDKFLPWWMRDRTPGKPSNLNVGNRFIWSLIGTADDGLDNLMIGLRSAFPGLGSTTDSLPWIGRSRGLLRGESDTDDDFVSRLLGWLDQHRDAAAQYMIAKVIHEYVVGRPRVRVFQRGRNGSPPTCVTIETDGSSTLTKDAVFDWDSVSNPERNTNEKPYWSDAFVVVYPQSYEFRSQKWGTTGLTWGFDQLGFGQNVTRQSYDAVHTLFDQWKGAHSRIRVVIWATRDGDFSPDGTGGTTPDGTWGQWSKGGSGPRTKSNRDYVNNRFWTPK